MINSLFDFDKRIKENTDRIEFYTHKIALLKSENKILTREIQKTMEELYE